MVIRIWSLVAFLAGIAYSQTVDTMFEPHFARGGGWSTTVYVTLTGTIGGECQPLGSSGDPMGPVAYVSSTVGAGRIYVAKATFPSNSETLSVGYLRCTFPVQYDQNTGQRRGTVQQLYSLFSYKSSSGTTLEAASSSLIHMLKSPAGTGPTAWRTSPTNMYYDSTEGTRNGLACFIRDYKPTDSVAQVTLVDDSAPQETRTQYNLTQPAGLKYFAVTLEDLYPNLVGKVGYIEFPSSFYGSPYICVGFRFSSSGNFTNAPTF